MAVQMRIDGVNYPIPHDCVGNAEKIRKHLTGKAEGQPGLPKAKVDALFEPPKQAEATEPETGGNTADEEE